MKIRIITIGKTNKNFVDSGIEEYQKRLSRYCNIEFLYLPDVKNASNLSFNEIKDAEGKKIVESMKKFTGLKLLLDEKGKEYTTKAFTELIENKMNNSQDINFIIGGAWGFSEEVKSMFQDKMALSKMTFTHQMVRLFLIEQIYRAFSIINNLPYHNE